VNLAQVVLHGMDPTYSLTIANHIERTSMLTLAELVSVDRARIRVHVVPCKRVACPCRYKWLKG
jgi:hypothetical protein